MKTKLIARVVTNGEVVDAYVREIELPFIPVVGMRFKQGTSTWLWETKDGVLDPRVSDLVYDLDEECVAILFEIQAPLVSTFWTRITCNLQQSHELKYYQEQPN